MKQLRREHLSPKAGVTFHDGQQLISPGHVNLALKTSVSAHVEAQV